MSRKLSDRMRKAGIRRSRTDAASSSREAALAQHALVMQEQERIARIAEQARNRSQVRTIYADATQFPTEVRSRVVWTNCQAVG